MVLSHLTLVLDLTPLFSLLSSLPQRHEQLRKYGQLHKKEMGKLLRTVGRIEAEASKLAQRHQNLLAPYFQKLRQLKVEITELKVVVMFAGEPPSL